MARIVILSGIPTARSSLGGVLEAIEALLQGAALETEWIHVRALPAEDLIGVRFDSEPILKAHEAIAKAEALIVATPVYKASYTGVLKTYLDLLPPKALKGKLVLPVAMGGSFGHLLVIEHALKPVLSALGANRYSPSLYVVDGETRWKEDGTFELDEHIAHRLNSVVQQFIHDVVRTAHKGACV